MSTLEREIIVLVAMVELLRVGKFLESFPLSVELDFIRSRYIGCYIYIKVIYLFDLFREMLCPN